MKNKNHLTPYYSCLKQLTIAMLFIFISPKSEAQNIDIELLRKINIHRNTHLDPTFHFITKTATPLSFAVPITTYGIGLIQRDSNIKNKGTYIAASILTASIISTTLKYTVNRERPFVTYPEIQKLSEAGSKSFPSGHTSTAFATATSLSISFPKYYVIIPAYLWASAVGYSRMNLGVHYPTDVLGGMITGSGSAWLCYKANQWINARKTHSSNTNAMAF